MPGGNRGNRGNRGGQPPKTAQNTRARRPVPTKGKVARNLIGAFDAAAEELPQGAAAAATATPNSPQIQSPPRQRQRTSSDLPVRPLSSAEGSAGACAVPVGEEFRGLFNFHEYTLTLIKKPSAEYEFKYFAILHELFHPQENAGEPDRAIVEDALKAARYFNQRLNVCGLHSRILKMLKDHKEGKELASDLLTDKIRPCLGSVTDSQDKPQNDLIRELILLSYKFGFMCPYSKVEQYQGSALWSALFSTNVSFMSLESSWEELALFAYERGKQAFHGMFPGADDSAQTQGGLDFMRCYKIGELIDSLRKNEIPTVKDQHNDSRDDDVFRALTEEKMLSSHDTQQAVTQTPSATPQRPASCSESTPVRKRAAAQARKDFTDKLPNNRENYLRQAVIALSAEVFCACKPTYAELAKLAFNGDNLFVRCQSGLFAKVVDHEADLLTRIKSAEDETERLVYQAQLRRVMYVKYNLVKYMTNKAPRVASDEGHKEEEESVVSGSTAESSNSLTNLSYHNEAGESFCLFEHLQAEKDQVEKEQSDLAIVEEVQAFHLSVISYFDSAMSRFFLSAETKQKYEAQQCAFARQSSALFSATRALDLGRLQKALAEVKLPSDAVLAQEQGGRLLQKVQARLTEGGASAAGEGEARSSDAPATSEERRAPAASAAPESRAEMEPETLIAQAKANNKQRADNLSEARHRMQAFTAFKPVLLSLKRKLLSASNENRGYYALLCEKEHLITQAIEACAHNNIGSSVLTVNNLQNTCNQLIAHKTIKKRHDNLHWLCAASDTAKALRKIRDSFQVVRHPDIRGQGGGTSLGIDPTPRQFFGGG